MLRAVSMIGLAALPWAVGCGPGPEPPIDGSDIRIDKACPDAQQDNRCNDDPNSIDTRMCVNADGHVYIVWMDDRAGKTDVWFNRSLDIGRSWLPAAVKVSVGNVDGPAGAASALDIACTNDRVYVVWEDDRDGELGRKNIYLAWSDNGGESWAPDVRLDPDEDGYSQSLGPKIIAKGSFVYVVWYDDFDGAYDILAQASRDRGQTWLRQPVRADADQAGDSYSASPQLAATGNGEHLYTVWEDSRAGKSDIYFQRGAWDADRFSFRGERRIDTGDTRGQHYSFEPRIAAYNQHVYVVWHDERNGEARDVLMNYSSDYGNLWLPLAERAGTKDSNGAPGLLDEINPHVAVSGSTAHVVWQNAASQEGGYDIYYRQAKGGKFLKGEAARLDRDPAGFANSEFPQVTAGEDSMAVVWEDGRDDVNTSGYDDLYYNFLTQDLYPSWAELKSWADPDLRIDAMEPGQSFKVDVNAKIFRQELLVAWTDGRNGTSDVYFKHLKVGDEAEYKGAEDGGGQ